MMSGESPVAADINNIFANVPKATDCKNSPGESLKGYNDWANLKLNFRQYRAFAEGATSTESAPIEMDAETAQVIENRVQAGAPTVVLLPYQELGYRVRISAPGVEPTFEGGRAAFGSGGACPLQPLVRTEWPVNSELRVEHDVTIPRGIAKVRIFVSVDNDLFGVSFNGVSIDEAIDGQGNRIALPIEHEQCSVLDEYRLDVPQSLVRPGQNVVVFQARDRGVESFFDARILGELLIGDLNGDGNVDRLDMALLLKDRNVPTIDSACGPACDLDANGRITGSDARALARLCTRPGCRIE